MKKIKAGIIGGAGYTAGELIRLLIHHPGVEISYVQSESQAGKPLATMHQDLFFINDMKFTGRVVPGADVVFLCKGHGESAKILEGDELDPGTRIIDLSQDFRIDGSNPEVRRKYGDFVYGLPEINREAIKKAKNIANPGCFATCIQLGLLPLADKKLLNEDVHISAITGSTGAGQKLAGTSHFSWRNNNMSVYKPFTHQHLKEIYQSIGQCQGEFDRNLFFIPYRGNFTRGIIATLYTRLDISGEEGRHIFNEFYGDHPFVSVSETNIHLKQVVNTNFGLVYIENIQGQLMVISMIDNLLKGASGQAVQNMNLMFGLDESMGLNLKSSAF